MRQAEHKQRRALSAMGAYLRLLARNRASRVCPFKAENVSGGGTSDASPLPDAKMYGGSYIDPMKSWDAMVTHAALEGVSGISVIKLGNERSNL